MRREPRHSSLVMALVAVVVGCAFGQALFAQPTPSRNTHIRPAPPQICNLLDNPALRQRMDGLLFNLLWSCGRQNELGHQPGRKSAEDSFQIGELAFVATDVLVNNPAGETGNSTTQSETSIAYNPVTGTYCSAFNDSWEFYGSTGGGGLTGFARSIDGGISFQDREAVGPSAFGDPSLTWRKADGFFYLATLDSGGGLAVWRSTDDCGNFSLLSIPTTGGDDKEILIADNNPASPNYGNLYLVWTDFGVGGTPIRATRSTNGGLSWSAPVNLSAAGVVQGAWPAVAPNGDVFVAWLRYASWPTGNISIEVARSTNGGVSYFPVTSPLTNAVSPRDSAASSACGRPALKGNIRYLASPQIAADGSGVLHVVYSQDPDVFNSGDVVNVYYRRSTDSGASWSAPIQLNDVATNDQYFPTIQANGSVLVAGWYDRRNDSANLLQDYYKRVSTDGGLTWGANQRVTDVNSPIRLDPGLATCYHGDYDQSVVIASGGHVMQWADDRNFVGSRNDPDVWTDRLFPVFADVPLYYWARRYIEAIYFQGITGGCALNPLRYCPEDNVSRAQAAVFLITAKGPAGYVPPACTTPIFNDVPCSHWAARWINEFARRGITVGCGGGNYCPDGIVDRGTMAYFLLATLGIPAPTTCTGMFSDVPCTVWYAPWVEELARRGITGGCGGGQYCPTAPTSRAQMAVFLVGTFSIPLPP